MLQLARAFVTICHAAFVAVVVGHRREQPIAAEVGGKSSPIALEQSPLVGLGRVAALELPDLRPRLLDLDPQTISKQTNDAATVVTQELNAAVHEGEVAYRDGKRFVAPSRTAVRRSLRGSASTLSAALAIPRGLSNCESRKRDRSMH